MPAVATDHARRSTSPTALVRSNNDERVLATRSDVTSPPSDAPPRPLKGILQHPRSTSTTAPSPDTSPEELTPRSRSLASLLHTMVPRPRLVLENSGSVARDHLASERTWLAYVRTSLAIASTGVALVQLFTISTSENRAHQLAATGVTLQRFARPLGAATVLFALCVLGIGVHRYFKIQKAMTQGHFPAARNTVVIITALLAALVAITFAVLVALPR